MQHRVQPGGHSCPLSRLHGGIDHEEAKGCNANVIQNFTSLGTFWFRSFYSYWPSRSEGGADEIQGKATMDQKSTDWKSSVRSAVSRLCGRKRTRIFTLDELVRNELDQIRLETGDRSDKPRNTLRWALQKLRDDGFIVFIDYQGTYRLL